MGSPARVWIDYDRVRAFLLEPRTPVTAEVLRGAGLAAYAYAALPSDDVRRGELRGDFLRSVARHQTMRLDVSALVRAWAEVGIEALLYKGVHLAEFVYPTPGMRFHGDVDILVRSEQARAAVAVAREVGWRETMRRKPWAHEVCGLVGPAGTKVDLHRYVLHGSPLGRAQRRITRAVWVRSHRVEWAGTIVRVPAPVDAFLVGLVLQRMWSDRGYLKPHDALDSRLLQPHIEPGALDARARELGCERTLAYFLERCDPDRGILEPIPSAEGRTRLARIVRRERGPLAGEWTWMRRIVRAPQFLFDLARVLPGLVEARHRLRNESNLRRLFEQATPALPRERSSERHRARTVWAIRSATRLLRLNPNGDCVLRSFAIYRALRHEGWPVSFVSGVRRAGGLVDGHAWVEYQGQVLPELGEPMNPLLYRESFRWPPANATTDRAPPSCRPAAETST